ncbi:hypothetical protein [Fontivita pretiosa]|uniref:hypothetical protein n=1 Tax=Fontivita pretiosa TaxID=2989684 RepID=UPI003D170574
MSHGPESTPDPSECPQFFPDNLGWSLSKATIVQHAYHAMSHDEGRFFFPVTRVDRASEMWFHGVHGTVGASDITYDWMIEHAQRRGARIEKPQGLMLDQEMPWEPNGGSSRDADVFNDNFYDYPHETFPW